ncbi:hypothetical protein [Nocardiopsis sp. B62]|uniref:hypothetical protein n=1 Tax=Nocardiopsis sp. B62 TaxID=2824874 RepID=UPI001B38A80C|nr:hypothetical protein [Nocardiopsis sp. B62]MBQ1083023.1 hypothetical protein [Nocardiopsis sp. B62]
MSMLENSSWPEDAGQNRSAHRPGEGSDVLGDLGLGDDQAGVWSTDEPAPGASLPPFPRSLSMERTRFTVDLPDRSTATVDVDHLAGRASLYRDDRHVRTCDMPARFALGPDHLEVAASRYGMKRIHLVHADGRERRLDPAPGTPEHWRAQLSREHPGLGRALAVCAVLVLAINLILLAPQALDLLTHQAFWADHFSSFDSPVSLPAWANTALTLATCLAGTERALTFRHHRLLDVETDGIAD